MVAFKWCRLRSWRLLYENCVGFDGIGYVTPKQMSLLMNEKSIREQQARPWRSSLDADLPLPSRTDVRKRIGSRQDLSYSRNIYKLGYYNPHDPNLSRSGMWAAGHAQNTGHDPNGRAQPLAHAAPLSVSHLLLGDCNDPKFMQILCTIYNQTTKPSKHVKSNLQVKWPPWF